MLNLSITCHKSYYKLVAKLNFVNQDESQRLELKFNFARLPYAPTESVTPWNVPPYDNHFSHLIGSSYDNGLISQSRFQSDETEEVAQASETQKAKGKEKRLTRNGRARSRLSSLIYAWAEKHERLESKDAIYEC